MILHVAPSAPFAVRALADAALAFHIAGGTAGLAAGTVAMVAKKGDRLHRLAGNVFFFAMLVMSGVGAVVAPLINDIGSAFGGAITFYLVITGWRAGRQERIKGGWFDAAGVALLAVAAVVVALMGRQALTSPTHTVGGEPAFAFFVVATIAGLIAALDLKMLLGPPLTGPRRLARHIWRMGLGLFIALMSGLAQPKVGGAIFHGSPLQWIPVAALVLTIAYWLARTRRPGLFKPRRRKPAAIAATTEGALS